MKELIGAIREVLKRGEVDELGIHEIQDAAVRNVPLLQRELCCRDYEPGRYLLYKDPNHGFVVMMLVWNKGQVTPIHGHGVWGVEAVVRNYVRVTNYTACNTSPKEIGSVVLPPGSVAYVLPPDADVHTVAQYGEEAAITVHIYGRELIENLVFIPGEGFKPVSVVAKQLQIDFDWRDRFLPDGVMDFQI